MIAWVTGGGTGIGRALAELLVRQGARVVITGRRSGILQETQRQISAGSSQGEIVAIPGDATDPSHIENVVSQTKSRWGPINLLINNAGVNSNQPYSEASVDGYRQSFEINCVSAIGCTSAVLPGMLSSGGGGIANISSVLGRWASAGSASYSVGKYALTGFTDTLRQAMVGTPIHVLGVYPGFIRTDMTLPFVKEGSIRSYVGKNPSDLARAILKALQKKKAELYYPWYVPWFLWLHRRAPTWADRLAARLRH